MKIIFLFIFVIGCSNIKVIDKDSNKKSAESKSLIDEVVNVDVLNGKVQFVNFTFRAEDGTYKLDCTHSRLIKIQVRKNKGMLYLVGDYFKANTNYECSYMNQKILNVSVGQYDYPSEKLNVDQRKVVFSNEDLARIQKEQAIMNKVYSTSANEFLFYKPFVRPLNSFVTSYYGNQRVFNNLKKSQHLGNDLRAAIGVKIPSANRGKVVYTGDLFFAGKVVVIDHGMDIFSMYGHLSKILITEGSLVNQGDIIGLSGATGRVSGPHLHWGVKIHGSWIDGFNLVEVSEKHFN